MPGRLFLARPTAQIAKALGRGPLPDQPARRNIAPGQEVLAVTPKGHGMMRWGMIPVGRVNARGRPVMETIANARSETLFDKTAFSGTGRAVVPADGWYEWTGKTGRKTPWAIRRADGAPIFFAAVIDVWQAPGGRSVPQIALITCDPNGDLRGIHHRMGAILTPDTIEACLSAPPAQAKKLLTPLPDGMLTITKAEGIDWNGP